MWEKEIKDCTTLLRHLLRSPSFLQEFHLNPWEVDLGYGPI
ncbi:hypothetical protein HanRHA438_Chr14g0631111 [Helianthus annuus]|uniref:Uncharacterized protein n=1 Tax=Helianthus annuus TaxID=4232 RepID=A0A9K3H5J2_HELAN|nr:hypothetical protein HanXRQr2_Chr14g0621251 [Helianthus annuus]KAJ0462776.1 hypothetical protein HanHA300_Chr14g0507871 [Helianthus annuus]KAJ0466448.1 hypothetical protein HanIR_Chr14g0672281 [Helianthus annuus]KAJ0484111.1 hypothetical protein HanHA89_Chr14g0540531 [Helianthus annuus]KAJ0654693.1 hypothetical protein HanLR1_Chr14g0510041 [Helianthus annuus]